MTHSPSDPTPIPSHRSPKQINLLGRSLRQSSGYLQPLGMLGILGALCLLFGLLSDSFFSLATLTTIANQAPTLTLVSVGMTFVLIVGGIDLSVGSMIAFSSAIIGTLMVEHHWPLYFAIPICVLSTATCGCLSGSASIGARIPSFIVTLGMLEILRGGTYLLTKSKTIYIGQDVEWIGAPLPGFGLSPAFFLAISVVAIGQFVLSATVWGRYWIAIGANREAVRMSGIRTAPYAISVFALSGFLCGLAGWIETSRLSSTDPNGAIGLELSAIAACVIGGTSLQGGRGSVASTFLGVLIIQVLLFGLAKIGADEPAKRIVTGSVIVAAVLLDALRRGET